MPTQDITITVTTPSGVTIASVLDVLATGWEWNSDMGLTKAQFVRKKIAEFLRETYIGFKATADGDAARTSAASTAALVIVA